jgi:hypothetical protein
MNQNESDGMDHTGPIPRFPHDGGLIEKATWCFDYGSAVFLKIAALLIAAAMLWAFEKVRASLR